MYPKEQKWRLRMKMATEKEIQSHVLLATECLKPKTVMNALPTPEVIEDNLRVLFHYSRHKTGGVEKLRKYLSSQMTRIASEI